MHLRGSTLVKRKGKMLLIKWRPFIRGRGKRAKGFPKKCPLISTRINWRAECFRSVDKWDISFKLRVCFSKKDFLFLFLPQSIPWTSWNNLVQNYWVNVILRVFHFMTGKYQIKWSRLNMNFRPVIWHVSEAMWKTQMAFPFAPTIFLHSKVVANRSKGKCEGRSPVYSYTKHKRHSCMAK